MTQIHSLHNQYSQSLKIGMIGSSFIFDIPSHVQSFKKLYPEITLYQKRYIWKELDEALQKNTLDIAFTIKTEGARLHDSNYEMTILKEGSACIAVSTAHPLADLESSNISVIKGEPLALMDRNQEPLAYEGAIEACKKHNFLPNIVAEYPYIEPLLALVNMNEAITCTSTLAPLDKYEQIKTIRLIPEEKMWLVMLSKKKNVKLGQSSFVDYIKSIYTEE